MLLTGLIGATALQAAADGVAHVNATASWTVYHGNALGTGADTSGVTFSPPNPAWKSPVLDGQVYGEPLEATGRVFVATENDTVYALAADTGAVLWSTHVATPVPSGDLPCGDIGPQVGITGTPVVDAARGEIFAVADEDAGGSPSHVLVGLNIYTGTVDLNVPVNPPGQDPADILQRTGLNLSNGNVVFGYGGNDGDCATYSGWVGSVPEGGGSPSYYQAVPIGHDGAVWMGGAAPVVSPQGDIWVSTGNGSVHSASGGYDDSDGLLEISPTMHLVQFFAPTSWPQNNASDLDMTMEPVLLANNQVVLAGKSRIVYLLNAAHLGGIGNGEATQASGCAGDMNGGTAVVGSLVYMPCSNGLVAMRVLHSPAALRIVWHTGVGGGPPIVAAGLLWTIGQDGTLYGLNPTSGVVRVTVRVGAPANHFATPSVGDGLLLVPIANQVVAFPAT